MKDNVGTGQWTVLFVQHCMLRYITQPNPLPLGLYRLILRLLGVLLAGSLQLSGFSVHCFCLVAQFCPILCNPMDCSLPGSPVHRFLQARILEWVVISPPPGDLPDAEIEPMSHFYILICIFESAPQGT